MEGSTVDFSISPSVLAFATGLGIWTESAYRTASKENRSPYINNSMILMHAFMIALLVQQFFLFVLPNFRAFPYSDDWLYAEPLQFQSLNEWGPWLWRQHVDHRIPIPKLLSYFTLRAAEYDFRYLVGLNYLLGLTTIGALLYIAKSYRGALSAGDMMFAFALLSFSTGFSLWGFQMQFVSSIFFFGMFLLLSFAYAQRGQYWLFLGAVIALACNSMCGMNGLLYSTIGSFGLAAWFAIKDRQIKFLAPLAVSISFSAFIWFTWSPTDATGGAASLSTILTYIFHLIPSSMGVFGFDDRYGWKCAIIALVSLAAFTVLARLAVRREFQLQDYILLLGCAASAAIILSVALGRSKVQGAWNDVIAMHYGSLSIFLPACAWIIVSKHLNQRIASAFGLVLAGVFFFAFVGDQYWRDTVIAKETPHQQQIVNELEAGADPVKITEKYSSDFSFTTEQNPAIVTGIKAFRAIEAPLYGQ